ncbi:MAG: hypothetical protein R3C20_02450 [Planctomycetaceae bacterium]
MPEKTHMSFLMLDQIQIRNRVSCVASVLLFTILGAGSCHAFADEKQAAAQPPTGPAARPGLRQRAVTDGAIIAPAPVFGTIWDLRVGDAFQVDVHTTRQTTMTSKENGNRFFETKQRSQIRLEYRVMSAHPDGSILLNVGIANASRSVDAGSTDSSEEIQTTTSEQVLESLRGLTFSIALNHDGSVRKIGQDDFAGLLNRLTGLNPEAEAILRECGSAEVLASWLATPFWFDGASTESRDVIQEVPLGLLGRMKVAIRLDSTVEDEGAVESDSQVPPSGSVAGNQADSRQHVGLSGNGRYLPPDGNHQTQSPVRFLADSVQLDLWRGKATIIPHVKSDSVQSRTRPVFDKLDMTCVIHGECLIKLPDTRISVEFEQTQVQAWSVTAWQMRRGFDQFNRLSMPIERAE